MTYATTTAAGVATAGETAAAFAAGRKAGRRMLAASAEWAEANSAALQGQLAWDEEGGGLGRTFSAGVSDITAKPKTLKSRIAGFFGGVFVVSLLGFIAIGVFATIRFFFPW